MRHTLLSKKSYDIADHFDSLAAQYDSEVGWRSDPKLLKVFSDENLEPHELIADIGCGTGVLSTLASKRNYVGFDLSIGMLKNAMKSGRIFVNANALNLPVKSAVFHAIWARQILQYIDLDMFMHEAMRVGASKSVLLTQHFTVLNGKDHAWWKKFKNHLQPHRRFLFTDDEIIKSAEFAGWHLSNVQHDVHRRTIDLDGVSFSADENIGTRAEFLRWVAATHHEQVPGSRLLVSGKKISFDQRWSSIKFTKR